MTSPDSITTALLNHAKGSCCLSAAAELVIAQAWLNRDDFASRFITVCPSPGSGKPVAVIDWPAAVAALDTSLPCSGGEQRMLKLTASLADGIPVDLRDTLTGLDDRNIQLLITAIHRAAGRRPQQEPFSRSDMPHRVSASGGRNPQIGINGDCPYATSGAGGSRRWFGTSWR